jgi:four helix bundle protein
MTKNRNSKQYDLEERTLSFARSVVSFCRKLPRTVIEAEIAKQLVRAATSVGANYIEANEALGKKDFLMRIKICRKEAKESGYWLRLLEVSNSDLRQDQEMLLKESMELTKIFSSILTKSQ